MGKKVLVATPRSGHEIDQMALKIVADYQPKMLTELQQFDVKRFFECELEALTSIKFDYQILQNSVHGVTDIERMECVVCSTLLDNPSQIKFLRSTIAHELGHCFLHVPEFRRRKQLAKFINNDENATLQRRSEDNIPLYVNPEWQAFRFGGALLIPRPSLELALKRGINDENDLCEIFNVHLPFMQSRRRALKI